MAANPTTAKDTAVSRTSRVGKRPVSVPKGVTVSIAGAKVQIKGPKGTLSRDIPRQVAVKQEGEILNVSCTAPGRDGARLQGLVRALLANMVKGVAEGYERTLEFHGTGYRAELRGRTLHFALGFSHPVEFPLPEGMNADVPKDSKGQLLILTGPDKEVIGQAAATIRGFRPPEPYGGKGVRHRGERIREKAGKAGK
jgi:large subunit ribosomal protein L6